MIQPSLRPQLGLLAKTPKCDLSMWFELLLSMMARFQKQALSESYRYILKERQKKREREREWISMSNISPLMTQPQKSYSIATSTANPLSCWVWPSYKGRSYILHPLMEDSGISGRELGIDVTLWPSLESTSHHVILPCISLMTQWGFHDSCDFLFVQ